MPPPARGPGNLIQLLINMQLLNGVITPIILTFILVLANRRSVLGVGLAQGDPHRRRAPPTLPETRDLAISRYELPNLGAVNFLIRGLLGTGATSTPRLDAQTKALGEWLRSRSTKVPQSLIKT